MMHCPPGMQTRRSNLDSRAGEPPDRVGGGMGRERSPDSFRRVIRIASLLVAGASEIRIAVYGDVLPYTRIAVTVIDPATALLIRRIESKLCIKAIIIAAHITALSRAEVQDLLDLVDIVTGCASKHVRDLVKPLAQVGTAISLFALTQSGKELLVERAKEIETPVLINTMPLPVLPEQKQPTGWRSQVKSI